MDISWKLENFEFLSKNPDFDYKMTWNSKSKAFSRHFPIRFIKKPLSDSWFLGNAFLLTSFNVDVWFYRLMCNLHAIISMSVSYNLRFLGNKVYNNLK